MAVMNPEYIQTVFQDTDGFLPHARLAIFFGKRKKSLGTWIRCQLRGESVDFQGICDIF